jgi:hypothetical protein
MKTSLVALAALSFFASIFVTSQEAKAGTCWYETEYYEKYGCKIAGKTPAGKYILICCD